MSEDDYLEMPLDQVRNYRHALDEDDRKFIFRREARKWHPPIDPQTIEDFIDAHDFY